VPLRFCRFDEKEEKEETEKDAVCGVERNGQEK